MKILDEVTLMFQRINKKIDEKEELPLLDYLDIGVGSIINSILFGYRFEGVNS